MRKIKENLGRYIHIATYLFDDIWPTLSMPGLLLFNEGLAERIVTDFDAHRSGCESLLVHCSRGRNRSPAVAIALNDIFGLGHDSGALKKQYNEANWYVYNTLIAYAKKSGVVR